MLNISQPWNLQIVKFAPRIRKGTLLYVLFRIKCLSWNFVKKRSRTFSARISTSRPISRNDVTKEKTHIVTRMFEEDIQRKYIYMYFASREEELDA